MGKIVVKIVTLAGGQAGSQTGGLADYAMLRPFKADVVLDTAVTGEAGGILPITQAQYDLVVA